MSIDRPNPSNTPIVVINAYHFCQLDQLASRKLMFIEQCKAHDLKGTILLSHEGINVAMSGSRQNIDRWSAWLRSDPLFKDIWLKETFARDFPFSKVVVKIKSEIISMRAPDIQPKKRTAPNVAPEMFQQWLDEGREMTILDARNDYEVAFGAFDGAVHPGIAGFKQFKEGLAKMDLDKSKPVVTYCTGGVRCEKSSAWMQALGFEEVYQLEGGILNYFEKVGGEHYHGECFVFDDRIALRTDLSESDRTQCEGCFLPVTLDEVAVMGPRDFHYCPSCASKIKISEMKSASPTNPSTHVTEAN